MSVLLKNALAVDPQVKLEEIANVLIDGNKISEVSKSEIKVSDQTEVRDLGGKYLFPGLVDCHVHLREPGYEYKEDIGSGTRAAVFGGFSDVCAMPNTNPVTDTSEVVKFIYSKAREKGHCNVHVAGACTKGLEGKQLAEIGDMARNGAVAFTDDGHGIQNAGMMRRVMEYALGFNRVVMAHCEDDSLVDGGQINEGSVSTKMGVNGWPKIAEEMHINRNIGISKLTGCPVHIQHVSTRYGLKLIRGGKKANYKVTCEVMPHHLFLTEDLFDYRYNTNLKVNPPLRTKDDTEALLEGLIDGSIDIIATDHAPHSDYEKSFEFERAPFGMTGLETCFALFNTNLLMTGKLPLARFVDASAIRPRQILGLNEVKIAKGSTANISIFDQKKKWTAKGKEMQSKGNNTGYEGMNLVGKASDVYINGNAILKNGKLA
ncbi:MAG: dihydroorotase [Eggerthellaceae bacterium]|nr:dihydroorotase [Eggerthellaceae bacterium]